jgi:hypothetical protein
MFGDDKKTGSTSEVQRVENTTVGPDKGLLNSLFGLNDAGFDSLAQGGTGISVNGYLWRAALDTISFMPLVTADPFGGVIITDWYQPPETTNERFKVMVYILDKELRADGLRVSVFRQALQQNGAWIEARVSEKTGTDIENAILKRARQMRIKVAR